MKLSEIASALDIYIEEHSEIPLPRHNFPKRHFTETWMARWQRKTGTRPDEVAISDGLKNV